jgi:Na+-translocating ferredoxin:NAD+ oxidoreductase RnfA subunit
MNSKDTDMLAKGLAVIVAEIALGVNGPFLFERFRLYLPLAIATAVVLGAAVGYGVAALLLRASNREHAAAPVPAVQQKAHPKAA